ncbi:hypothetical protein SNE40_017574 [Patella caerulea]|uniref:Uncharacterized protein n=1 Tax=Patella caerulea TaxID=87958 RepID=A0AAN8JBD6_PATCE
MEDAKILQEEMSEVRPRRIRTRSKGCSTKCCRPIRVKLNNLDFSFYPDIIESFRPRPLFFSIGGDFDAPATFRNKIARSILNYGLCRRSTEQMKNKINDDESRLIGDGATKPIHRDVKTMLIGDGEIKTILRDVTTRMIGHIIYGDVTTKVIRGHSATDCILFIKSSTIGFFLRNLNADFLISGTIPVRTTRDGSIYIDIGDTDKADEIMSRSLTNMTSRRNISETKPDRMALSYTNDVKYSTATPPRTLTEYQQLKAGDSLKEGACHRTTGDSFKDGACPVPVAVTLKEDSSHETNGSTKRHNFLTKLWKKITNHSNKKKESQKDERAVKTSRKSSKMSRFICFCRPKTAE